MNLDALSYDREKSITQQLVELDNQRPGLLKGFDCNICLNRGFITKYNSDKDLSYIVDCKCVKTRKSLKNAKESGMGELLSHKLRDFKATEPFQEVMRDITKGYILNARTEWFWR